MLNPTTYKTCPACETSKPTTDFYKSRSTASGLQAYCKDCLKAKRAAYYNTPAGKLAAAKSAAKQYAAGYNKFGKGAILNMQASAAAKGLPCTITQPELASWWYYTPDVCHYCGSATHEYQALRDQILAYTGFDYEVLKFGRFFRSPKHRAIQDLTVDRKDNGQGYELGNIVKACWICNSLKNDFWTEAQMQQLAPRMMAELRQRLD